MDERYKYMESALRFLFEMEMVDSDQVINHLKMNIYTTSPSITDTELLVDSDNKSILIWINLSFWGKLSRKGKKIFPEILEKMQLLLPNFRFRVITDKEILNKSIELSQKHLNNRMYK